ncbi:MAG: hypothetical protein IKC69_01025 [Clostridia bacterium]|nr:hypothetical protein [Clostridia bacterium]
MRSFSEWRELMPDPSSVDSHVHTHLCDGAADMTVDAIAEAAERVGLSSVILTPHFHILLEDETERLYENSREEILLALREEIDRYEKEGGSVRIFLSTEADIINEEGDLSLRLSPEAERALDFITPTLNFHPLLPLKFVHLSYGRDINALHDSGEFATAAEAVGGTAHLLRTEWEIRGRAVSRSPYPAMAGHVFAPCSKHPDRFAWFNPQEEQLPKMLRAAEDFLAICQKTGAAVDLAGVHLKGGITPKEKSLQNGFLTEFQSEFIRLCRRYEVSCYYGSDAHRLTKVGAEREYYREVLGL